MYMSTIGCLGTGWCWIVLVRAVLHLRRLELVRAHRHGRERVRVAELDLARDHRLVRAADVEYGLAHDDDLVRVPGGGPTPPSFDPCPRVDFDGVLVGGHDAVDDRGRGLVFDDSRVLAPAFLILLPVSFSVSLSVSAFGVGFNLPRDKSVLLLGPHRMMRSPSLFLTVKMPASLSTIPLMAAYNSVLGLLRNVLAGAADADRDGDVDHHPGHMRGPVLADPLGRLGTGDLLYVLELVGVLARGPARHRVRALSAQ